MQSLLEKLEEKFQKPYERWNYLEREEFQKWQQTLQKTEVSVADIKGYIERMLRSIVKESATEKNGTPTDLFLKARIRNYLLLLEFMEGPERAKKAVETQIEAIKKK